jgi:hypothetical protein
MDNFDLKKYLAEGRLLKENTEEEIKTILSKSYPGAYSEEDFEEIINLYNTKYKDYKDEYGELDGVEQSAFKFNYIINASDDEIVSDGYFEIKNAVEQGVYSKDEAVKLAKSWAKEKLSTLAEGRINEEDLENGLDNKIWDFRHLIKNFDPLDIKVGDTVITPTEGENIIDKIVKYGWDFNYGDIINFQFGNHSLSNKDLIQRNNRRK